MNQVDVTQLLSTIVTNTGNTIRAAVLAVVLVVVLFGGIIGILQFPGSSVDVGPVSVTATQEQVTTR